MNGLPKINEDQRDCLQEIVNVAMGQAGESLACLLEVFVQLGVPRIHLVACDDITPQLTAMIDAQHDKVTAVRQAFYRSKGKLDIQGEALLVFSDASLTDLTMYQCYILKSNVVLVSDFLPHTPCHCSLQPFLKFQCAVLIE